MNGELTLQGRRSVSKLQCTHMILNKRAVVASINRSERVINQINNFRWKLEQGIYTAFAWCNFWLNTHPTYYFWSNTALWEFPIYLTGIDRELVGRNSEESASSIESLLIVLKSLLCNGVESLLCILESLLEIPNPLESLLDKLRDAVLGSALKSSQPIGWSLGIKSDTCNVHFKASVRDRLVGMQSD